MIWKGHKWIYIEQEKERGKKNYHGVNSTLKGW